MTDVPYTFDRTHTTAELHEKYDSAVEDGQHTEDKVTIAGRLMLRRGQGKLAFGQLHDSSGQIQLFAPIQITPRFEEFTALTLGDWIGVTGTVMKTKKGELSVQVDDWVVLAEAHREFPDKWHGLQDTDTRYRQRYVDLWVTPESRATMLLRSRVVTGIRNWLTERGFMEVETPMLQPIPGGTTATPFLTRHKALDQDMYLRIAPELYLKRLVVGGFEKVFELNRNFRNEGISVRHNPEFTMLEVYEAYKDYNDFMELIESMVTDIVRDVLGTTEIEHQGKPLDLTSPWRRVTLVELVSEAVGEEISRETPLERLREISDKFVGHYDENWSAGKILMVLYEKTVEPFIWEPTFVMDMPKEVSPLARDHRTADGFTEHADLVICGRELAPIYSELVDPAEQRARLEAQNALRESGDEEAMFIDQDFLRALEYGMPPTAGLGFGVDRFLMLIADLANIKDALLFPTLRREVAE